jgi:hypothetical protein
MILELHEAGVKGSRDRSGTNSQGLALLSGTAKILWYDCTLCIIGAYGM